MPAMSINAARSYFSLAATEVKPYRRFRKYRKGASFQDFFNCFKGERKKRIQRKSWSEGFWPRKVEEKIKIEIKYLTDCFSQVFM